MFKIKYSPINVLLLFFLFISILHAEYGSQNSNYVLGGLVGPTSYVSVPHYSAFDQNFAGSIEMWVYPTGAAANTTLISKGSTLPLTFSWRINSVTRLMYFVIGTTSYTNTGGISIPLNLWTHVAVTWTGGPNFTVTFYVNGALSGSAVTNVANWSMNTDPVRIGGSQLLPGEYFQGKLDEVRFWSGARTQAQIAVNRFVGLGDGLGANSGNALTSSTHYIGLISSWTFNTSGAAFDHISGYNGIYNGSAFSQFQDAGIPTPYNLVLRTFGGINDYVRVPNNSIFNLSTGGTVELWFRPLSFSTDQTLISKGATSSTISFLLGVTNTGRLLFRTAGNPVASNGAPIALNAWNHIAATWTLSGGSYQVNFYVDGNQNGTTVIIPATFPTNSDYLYIGSSQAMANPAVGYIDEVRIWSLALPAQDLKINMFASGRGLLPNSDLIALWNFDGNLNNFSAISGINGSFNNGSVNNCRLSAYMNEATPALFWTLYAGHSTVINRGGTPNAFPSAFSKSAPFIPIPDNNPDGVSDSITVTEPIEPVTTVEVFVSIQHSYVGDLIISLRAPNGIVRNLTNRNGGSADNVLSFFNDAFTNLPSSSTYFPPWAFVKPIEAFGNFGGASVNGTWLLKCVDASSGETGVLQGWGLRFNNAVGIEIISGNIPSQFKLYQNYPNPFNPLTKIRFDIPKDLWDASVRLALFDVLGREVEVLVNEKLKTGSYEVGFDASNLSSGTYFYRLEAGNFTDTKKLVVLK